MKIIHIIPAFVLGGAEKFTIDLCNELSKKHEVTIYSLYDINEDMWLAKKIKKNINIVTFSKKAGLDISIFFKLLIALKRDKPDVVNTHLRGLFYSSLTIMCLKIKFFHTVHNMAIKEVNVVFRFIHRILFLNKEISITLEVMNYRTVYIKLYHLHFKVSDKIIE